MEWDMSIFLYWDLEFQLIYSNSYHKHNTLFDEFIRIRKLLI